MPRPVVGINYDYIDDYSDEDSYDDYAISQRGRLGGRLSRNIRGNSIGRGHGRNCRCGFCAQRGLDEYEGDVQGILGHPLGCRCGHCTGLNVYDGHDEYTG